MKLLRFGRWIFFRLQVKRKDRNPSLRPGLRLAQSGGPTARVSCPSFLPEAGRRSSFRNVILLKYIDDGQSPKKKKTAFTDYKAPSSEPFRLHFRHLCLPNRLTARNNSRTAERIFIKFDIVLSLKFVDTFQFWFRLDNSNGHFA
jgi:hypothetical protein